QNEPSRARDHGHGDLIGHFLARKRGRLGLDRALQIVSRVTDRLGVMVNSELRAMQPPFVREVRRARFSVTLSWLCPDHYEKGVPRRQENPFPCLKYIAYSSRGQS